MHRLTGIGVSPGRVAGKAVILIQRAHVLRYEIGPERIGQELARTRCISHQRRSQSAGNVSSPTSPSGLVLLSLPRF